MSFKTKLKSRMKNQKQRSRFHTAAEKSKQFSTSKSMLPNVEVEIYIQNYENSSNFYSFSAKERKQVRWSSYILAKVKDEICLQSCQHSSNFYIVAAKTRKK